MSEARKASFAAGVMIFLLLQGLNVVSVMDESLSAIKSLPSISCRVGFAKFFAGLISE